MPWEYVRYRVCKEMGWDYWTYAQQPTQFIQEVLTCLEADAEYQEIKSREK